MGLEKYKPEPVEPDIDPAEYEGFDPTRVDDDDPITYWPVIEYISDEHGWYGTYPVFMGYDQP